MGISDQLVSRVSALVGMFLVGSFVLGLAWSISTGFAGFWGGFPFWCIALFVLCLCLYDFWTTAIRSRR